MTTLKSRILNYNIQLKSEESFDISKKILGKKVKELIHEQMINNYSTPGSILNLLNFADTNGVDLTQMNLKDFIKMIINEKKYKNKVNYKTFKKTIDKNLEISHKEFKNLNIEYRNKFVFPFIIAVKGKNKKEILNSFRRRIENEINLEFNEDKEQVKKIATFRLNEIIN